MVITEQGGTICALHVNRKLDQQGLRGRGGRAVRVGVGSTPTVGPLTTSPLSTRHTTTDFACTSFLSVLVYSFFIFFLAIRVPDKADHSAFESTLNSFFVLYRIVFTVSAHALRATVVSGPGREKILLQSGCVPIYGLARYYNHYNGSLFVVSLINRVLSET